MVVGVLAVEKAHDIVYILKQYRHDWLNKIQLIKGNMELGRADRVEQLINEVILQSKSESDLSNLKMDRVASRLLTFNWDNHPYIILYEIIGGERDWRQKEDMIVKVLDEIFSILDQSARLGEENELLLVFYDVDKYKLQIDFHGKIENDQLFKEKIKSVETHFHKNIGQIEWSENGYLMSLEWDN